MRASFFAALLFACLFQSTLATAQCNAIAALYGSNSVCVAGTTQTYFCALNCTYGFEINLTNGTFAFQYPVGTILCGALVTYSSPTRLIGTGEMSCPSDPFMVKVNWGTGGSTIQLKGKKFSLSSNSFISTQIVIGTPSDYVMTGASGTVCKSTTSLPYSVNTPAIGGSQVWSAISSAGAPPLNISCPTCPNVTISGFQPNKLYNITCKIYCNNVQVAQRTKQVFTGGNCFSKPDGEIEDREAEDFSILNEPGIEVFPNPVAQGEPLIIQLPEENDTKFQVRVLDLTGKILYNNFLQGGSNPIDLGTLAAGMYIAQINYSGQLVTKRFSVN